MLKSLKTEYGSIIFFAAITAFFVTLFWKNIFVGLICGLIVAGIIAYGQFITSQWAKKTKYNYLAEEKSYSKSVLLLVTAIIKADQKQSDSEFRFLEKELLESYLPADITPQIEYVKKAYDKGIVNYKNICRVLKYEYEAGAKIQLMHLLIGIAAADGLLTKIENGILRDIAKRLRIPYKTYISLLNMFHFRHEQAEYKQKRKSYSSKLRIAQAYKILEITESATVEQIKKAYRKLALIHHPDRVIHLGKDYQKTAHERFQTISDAYEYIKDRKGFS